MTFHPDKYHPLLEDTKKLLTSVNDPEVAALFLVRRFTQDVVNTRLTCDTAKYQQVIICKSPPSSEKIVLYVSEFVLNNNYKKKILEETLF